MFFKIDDLKRLSIFTGKHRCWSLFLINLITSVTQLYQKETPTHGFSCEYCKAFQNSFLYRTPLVAASEFLTKLAKNNCKENHFSLEIFSEIS